MTCEKINTMPVDYQKAKIYKIICDEDPTLVYYGSTCTRLSNRFAVHRSSYFRFQAGKGHNVTSFQIVGFESAKIILVENFTCNSKEELCARERHWIDNNTCVNKQRPGATLGGMKQYHIEYRKENAETIAQKQAQYYKDNAETIAQKQAKYRKDNADIIAQKRAQYYKDNAAVLNSKHKKYYAANKNKINDFANENINCECGSHYTRRNKSTHLKSRKHARKMLENEITNEIAAMMLIDV